MNSILKPPHRGWGRGRPSRLLVECHHFWGSLTLLRLRFWGGAIVTNAPQLFWLGSAFLSVEVLSVINFAHRPGEGAKGAFSCELLNFKLGHGTRQAEFRHSPSHVERR